MKIEASGPIRLVIDEAETIRGIWVEHLEHAQLEDTFKPRLRMFLAMLEAQGDRKVPVEVYAAFVEGDFRVEKNSPTSGGGFFLMLHTGSGSVHAAVRATDPRKAEMSGHDYWQCPTCGGVLKKGFGTMFKTVSGTATCGGCGAQFPQQDVYGGLYDVEIIDLKAQTIRQIDSGLKRPAQTEQRKQWWQFWK